MSKRSGNTANTSSKKNDDKEEGGTSWSTSSVPNQTMMIFLPLIFISVPLLVVLCLFHNKLLRHMQWMNTAAAALPVLLAIYYLSTPGKADTTAGFGAFLVNLFRPIKTKEDGNASKQESTKISPATKEKVRAEGTSDEDDDDEWILTVRVVEEGQQAEYPLLLTTENMQEIAKHVLPRSMSHYTWKRIFSIERDGDAFETCLDRLSKQKRTLLVLRTSRGALLGGFADTEWKTEGCREYTGSTGACLFKIVDNGKVIAFKWTGANRYMQLCDVEKKRLAFGGPSFGLSVERDFEIGSTGRCETFANEPLCDQETFKIMGLEIYAFVIGETF